MTTAGWWGKRDEHRWRARLADAVAFHDAHGRWPSIAPSDPKPGEPSLGKWVVIQRSKRRSGELSPRREAALRDTPGWNFDPPSGWHTNKTGDARWGAHLAEAVEFHASHGRWPSASTGLLGRWVAKQRFEFHAGRLRPDREQVLRDTPGWNFGRARRRKSGSREGCVQ